MAYDPSHCNCNFFHFFSHFGPLIIFLQFTSEYYTVERINKQPLRKMPTGVLEVGTWGEI